MTQLGSAELLSLDGSLLHDRPPLLLEGTYLGNGWVLSAGPVGAGAFVLDGVTYPAVPGSRVNIVHDVVGPVYADIMVFLFRRGLFRRSRRPG